MRLIAVACSINEDEFRLRSAYLRAMNKVGLCGVVLPPQAVSAADTAEILRPFCGLLLPGGGDLHPLLWGEQPQVGLGEVAVARDAWELTLASAAMAAGLPVLGICRGMQLLNVYFGGTLWQDLSARGSQILHSQTAAADTAWHGVTVSGGLADIFGRAGFTVNSLHHQGVRSLGEGVVPCAWAADGLVEAIAARDWPFVLGVQWHPEYLCGQKPLWQAFAAAAHTVDIKR